VFLNGIRLSLLPSKRKISQFTIFVTAKICIDKLVSMEYDLRLTP